MQSVVSGSVEPDTIIVKRGDNGLEIAKIELGSKKQRVKAEGDGVGVEDVPESERGVVCLSEEEILKLAKIGVAQEELWGAGRDIEWAISGVSFYSFFYIGFKNYIFRLKHKYKTYLCTNIL